MEVNTAEGDIQAQPPHCLGELLIGSGRFHLSLWNIESLLFGGAVCQFLLSFCRRLSFPPRNTSNPAQVIFDDESLRLEIKRRGRGREREKGNV